MESAPPSYETATLIDVWDIIARYLNSRELCTAALVCTRWHTTVSPYIWGNPASHFGIQNDAVYVALTRFKRTLQTARLLVRSLTHTLHLPPAHAEIYNGPHSDWLRDILEKLPNLQSLIVRGLPFFDYAALLSLSVIRTKRNESVSPQSELIELAGSTGSYFQRPRLLPPTFGLRLLDASRCPNITSSGLASALARFEGLLYLDLSFSYPARDKMVLETLRRFAGLQVLKLRGLNLNDDGVGILCKSIALRVRSLDLRDNMMTDRSIRKLLENCVISDHSSNDAYMLSSGQRSPGLLSYLGTEMLEIYQGEDFEGFLRNAFTGRFVSRLAIEDVSHTGLTHLYLADNPITVEGTSGLVRSERLHVLDVGSVAGVFNKPPSIAGQTPNHDVTMPGIEKLTPVFAKHATETMTFLRIDHSLVAKDAPNVNADEIVQGRVELDDSSLPYNTRDVAEVSGTSVRPEAFELPAEPQTPRFELPGDPLRFVVSPAIDDTFRIQNPGDEAHGPRRGSAFAPEIVASLAADMHRSTLLSPFPATDDGTSTSGWQGATSALESGSSASTPLLRPRSYSSMTTERRARVTAHALAGNNLHPAMLPHVTTLVLTNVPPLSPNRQVADRIIRFIKQCAEESSLARKQAILDYSAPPGRRGQSSALKYSADRIFALKRLVLELATVQDKVHNGKASPWVHQNTKSMTEDRDSEALWTASETDFSFFGDEECVFPTLDTDRAALYTGTSEKEVSVGQPSQHAPPATSDQTPRIDNVALISAFRKERKAAQQRRLAMGNYEVETEGLWNGVVQVVRSNGSMRSDEQEDYYGNKFTNNYLYR